MKIAQRTANNWLPSLIDEMFNNDYAGGTAMRTTHPAVNISESEDHFSLEMVIPGFSKDDVTIEVDKDILSIYAEVENKQEETTEQFTRKEFVKKSFKRSFNLPDTVNQDAIKGSYNNGILSLALPKKEEALPKAKRTIALQ